ncbi:GntR family transcriptional regulator [bacterium]|nr:GntR family transcriptional regulator [bacterium]
MPFETIQSVNLREQVVEQIRTAIIEGRLRPNDHIVENTLTAQLGVSRTPVREALILLERDGLIVSYPHRGSYVRNFTVQDVEEIFTMRIALENFAGDCILHSLTSDECDTLENFIHRQKDAIVAADFKTVRSIDMSFHEYLIERANHALLKRNWRQIVAQIAAVLYLRAEVIPNYDEYLAIRDHQTIVDAYRQRDLAALHATNARVNRRVAEECKQAVAHIGKPS